MNSLRNRIPVPIWSQGRIASILFLCLISVAAPKIVHAQSIEDVRWKSEAQVEKLLGQPQRKTSPVGTHASYTLWKYDGFTVAFADSKAFHLFKDDSLNELKPGVSDQSL
ncbi:hypothetical protein [Arenicella sp. 4NH20-0111]|uniref:hypothetical protein n=1 Tax=Arenicella sp. 4NH20-0111 TaxID=3127648 RepID=UPI003342617B